MKTFNNIEELMAATKGSQLNAQAVINKRAHIDGEWQNFETTDNFDESFIDTVVNLLGGQHATKRNIRYALQFGTPQHWGLTRIMCAKYGESPCRWSYCAGQDYPAELSTIRKYLAK